MARGQRMHMLHVPGKNAVVDCLEDKESDHTNSFESQEISQCESEFRRGSGKDSLKYLPQIKIGYDLFGTSDDSYNELQNYSVNNSHQISL